MKYVIVDGSSKGALLFGPTISHKEVAVGLLSAYGDDWKDKIFGAGFCSFEWSPDGGIHGCGGWKVQVYGKSVTLGIESKLGDVYYIEFALNEN